METAFPLTWFGSWNEKMQTSRTKMSCKTWWSFGGVFVSNDLRRTNEQLFYRRLNISECCTLWFWGQSVKLVRKAFTIRFSPNVQVSVPSEVSSQQSSAAPRAFYFGADFRTYNIWCAWPVSAAKTSESVLRTWESAVGTSQNFTLLSIKIAAASTQ